MSKTQWDRLVLLNRELQMYREFRDPAAAAAVLVEMKELMPVKN